MAPPILRSALFGLLVALFAAQVQARRMALVIGQSAYKSVPALANPGNDARAVAQWLTDSGFEVSQASDLSQNQMRQTKHERGQPCGKKTGDYNSS